MKRGISTVVASILLILLAVVAVVIIWFLLKGFITKSAGGIETSCITLDLEIEKAEINADSNILYVQVKRGSGEGNLSGIRFKITNSSESMIRDRNTSMNELETKSFSFNDTGNVSVISKVEIAGVISFNNQEKICRIISSKNIFDVYTVPCKPNCEGKVCGDNGCGGSCGSCDDALSCTTDTCNSGTCGHVISSGTCLISGGCHNNGDNDTENDCQNCNIAVNQIDWTAKDNGVSCLISGSSGKCNKGVCEVGGIYYPNTNGAGWRNSKSSFSYTTMWTWTGCQGSGADVYTSDDLNTVSSDDGNYVFRDGGSYAQSVCHEIRFNISENPAAISKIDILVKQAGYGDGMATNLSLYIGNVSSQKWVLLDSDSYPTKNVKYVQTGSITSGISNYITSAGGNNYIYVLLVEDSGGSPDGIVTGYNYYDTINITTQQ